MQPCLQPRGSNRGFTLVELLVSMTVLTLLILFVSRLVNSATITTTLSRKHMDADSQARLVFSRIASDVAGILKRKDADAIFSKQGGNDKMFFYSEAPAYFSNSPSAVDKSSVSIVGYRVNASYQLERLGVGLTWDGVSSSATITGGPIFLTTPLPTQTVPSPTPDPASTMAGNWSAVIGSAPSYSGTSTNHYHPVAEQVFRFEYCFQLKNGAFSDNPYIAPNTSINGFQDVSAVVVALAILDTTSRKISTDMTKIVAALPDVDPATKSMSGEWLTKIKASDFAQNAGIPQAAASQVRVYQRAFYLPAK